MTIFMAQFFLFLFKPKPEALVYIYLLLLLVYLILLHFSIFFKQVVSFLKNWKVSGFSLQLDHTLKSIDIQLVAKENVLSLIGEEKNTLFKSKFIFQENIYIFKFYSKEIIIISNILFDRKRNCYKCIVIHQKHLNVLQYKESKYVLTIFFGIV